jgi:hypothetical protein
MRSPKACLGGQTSADLHEASPLLWRLLRCFRTDRNCLKNIESLTCEFETSLVPAGHRLTAAPDLHGVSTCGRVREKCLSAREEIVGAASSKQQGNAMERFTTAQATKLAGINRMTLQEWIRLKKIHPPKLQRIAGPAFRLWTTADVDRLKKFAAANKYKPSVRKKQGRNKRDPSSERSDTNRLDKMALVHIGDGVPRQN